MCAQPQATGECWEWKACRNRAGYGRKWIGDAVYLTHRLALAWANWDGYGDWKHIPDGMHVLHRCDNPACCNPEHLFLGTPLDNMRDSREKGRHFFAKKTHCPRGHAYDEANTHRFTYRSGWRGRWCRACNRIAKVEQRRNAWQTSK